MGAYVVPMFAFFGVMGFTYMVGKYGLVPAYNTVKGWFSKPSLAADLAALHARVSVLEKNVIAIVTPGAAPVAPPAMPPVK